EKRAPEDREAARLRQELAASKEYLQAMIEQQEATNEELKSANEELVTLNEQLQNRNAELTQLGDDLNNVLTGVNIPILIVGSDSRIRRFTPSAEKLLNLLPADLGRPLGNMRPNVELPDLDGLVAQVAHTLVEQEREVRDREGRWYSMRIRPCLTSDHKIEGALVTFIDIDAAKRGEAALRVERDFAAAVLETAAALVMVLDAEGRIIRFNRACQQASGYTLDEVKGRKPWEVLVAPEQAERVKALYQELLAGERPPLDEYYWVTRDGRRRLIAWRADILQDPGASGRYLIRSGVDITDSRQQEVALRESEAALRRSQTQLRDLAAALLSAQEEERRRVARELHDDVSQTLAQLAIETDSLTQRPPASPANIRDRLSALRQHIDGLANDLRRMSYQLHPAALEHLGLGAALRAYCADFSKSHGIKVRFRQINVPGFIPPDAALCMYRVAQESLGNAAKHSGTQAASVVLAGTESGIGLAVSDRGAGFDVEAVKDKKGLGLISMAERARLVGGTLSVKTRPGAGARIELRIPLAGGKA
ncbi:MAG: PAS domain-containing protein, partial [Armatimonadota bacterium]|nr:PAS domain-containing protein [Armatimonadota bacterium]